MRFRPLFRWLLIFFITLSTVIFCIALLGFFDARAACSWIPKTRLGESVLNNNQEDIIVLPGNMFSVHANIEGRVSVHDVMKEAL